MSATGRNGEQERGARSPHVFVKICGLTTPAAVSAAVEAGADATGFVFAESPRRVGLELACELAALVPRQVLRVAVLRHATREEIATVCEGFAPDVIQADAASLRGARLPCGVRALPVLRDGEHDDGGDDWLLYEGVYSGSGMPADWGRAAALARRRPLILAGGLDAHNVAGALRGVRPWGVDVSSGVEESRGVKSVQRIRDFVAAVRAAESVEEEA